MGLFTKKDDQGHEDEDEDVFDIEVIGRSDNPDDLPSYDYEHVGRDGEPMEDALTGGARDGAEAEPEPAAEDGAEAPADDVEDADGDEEPVREPDPEEPAADADDTADDGPADGLAVPFAERTLRMPLVAVALIAVALVAAVAGFFAGNGGFGAAGTGLTSLTEEQLGTPVASYTYNGAKKSVTAGEVLTNQYTADSTKNDDGSYVVPTAEYTVSYIRSRILADEAAARGIDATEEEMAEYCEGTLGTSDYDALAELYGISADDAKAIVRDACMTNKLYEQVVADKEAPAAPTSPEDGEEGEANATYGAYLVALLGDEWDADKGDWARTDGPYYAALGGEDFSADSATYEQAYTAYSVAYNAYLEESNQVWTDFANELFSKADVTLFGVGV